MDMLLIILCIVLVGIAAYLAMKMPHDRRRLAELHRLQAAHEEMDQQAKLIIRTDLELHRTQEELDRRLASLMSLHQLGRQLLVSLRPEEVFGKLDAPTVTNLGFSKALLGMCPSSDRLEWRSLIGVEVSVADRLKEPLLQQGLLDQILANPTPKLLDAATAQSAAQRQLLDVLDTPIVVTAGLIPHMGPAGCLVLGRTGRGTTQSKADEELVAIFANQLSTAIENSVLYEKTWASQRELEQKVQERTRELAHVNTKLVQLNRAKSEFVSAVSHELRTPLAAIKGYASLLRVGQFGAVVKGQSERLAKIEKHADLLTQLINNLLDIARIESGRVTMERRPFPIEEFLSTVQDVVHPQLEAKRIRFTVDLDGVKELVGDAQQLHRVFMNLLSNAIKYTPEKGEICIGFRKDGGVVVAAVSDTGCGMSPEDLPKLFQEFYRSSDPINQQVQGTGLGLALAKRIVEAHQGTIWVDSEKSKGSVFSIRLPAG